MTKARIAYFVILILCSVWLVLGYIFAGHGFLETDGIVFAFATSIFCLSSNSFTNDKDYKTKKQNRYIKILFLIDWVLVVIIFLVGRIILKISS